MFADELDGKDASGPDSFYKVYEPVFERNKRFAVILPAPSLGDDDTPIDEVRRRAFCQEKVKRENMFSFALPQVTKPALASFLPSFPLRLNAYSSVSCALCWTDSRERCISVGIVIVVVVRSLL